MSLRVAIVITGHDYRAVTIAGINGERTVSHPGEINSFERFHLRTANHTAAGTLRTPLPPDAVGRGGTLSRSARRVIKNHGAPARIFTISGKARRQI